MHTLLYIDGGIQSRHYRRFCMDDFSLQLQKHLSLFFCASSFSLEPWKKQFLIVIKFSYTML